MKKTKNEKRLGNVLNELHDQEALEGVIGYALFDTVKRAFVTFKTPVHAVYTGNVEEAYIADSRGEAFITMMSQVDHNLDIKVVPLIANALFGLSPRPGSLDDQYDKFHE